MGLTALVLLYHGMDVAESSLERIILEDRGGSGCMVERVDGLASLMDRPGRGEPDRRVVIEAEATGARRLTPDRIQLPQKKRARRTDPRLRLRHLGLD